MKPRSIAGLLPRLRYLVTGFLAGALVWPWIGTSLAEQTQSYTWGEQYRSIPQRYQRIIEDSERAFLARDAEASAASLADDFSWYRVTDEGPQQMVSGRAATLERLRQFFASPMWESGTNSEVHRLGMVGNTLVQVEIDTLNMGNGPVRQTSLHVYEFRDGKRWREFAFYPAAE